MKNFDRRAWLSTVGLAGSAALLGGFDAFSIADKNPLSRELLDSQLAILNANENPYGPSEKVRKAIIDAFTKGCRYPFRYANELKNALALKEGVSPDHIVLTAGSTEGLRITGLTYGMNGGEVIAADPTFQALLTYAEQFDATVHRVSLDENLQHDLPAMELKINSNTKLIFICNPNNPTGSLLPASQLTSFCEETSKKALIFSDEAYYDFIDEENYPSMTTLVKQGKNVVVSKTFSKVYGLAGIRIGYLIAKPDIARKIESNTVANVNVLGIFGALAALKDAQFYKDSLARNSEAKKYLYSVLDDLNLKYVDSQTNFIFFRSGVEISKLQSQMRSEGVEIGRPFPPLRKWCRISTGTMEDMVKFGEGLKKVLV